VILPTPAQLIIYHFQLIIGYLWLVNNQHQIINNQFKTVPVRQGLIAKTILYCLAELKSTVILKKFPTSSTSNFNRPTTLFSARFCTCLACPRSKCHAESDFRRTKHLAYEWALCSRSKIRLADRRGYLAKHVLVFPSYELPRESLAAPSPNLVPLSSPRPWRCPH